MGAAFRPSYWAQTLAKDAKGWVEGCCLHRKVAHILIYIYIYIFGPTLATSFDEVFMISKNVVYCTSKCLVFQRRSLGIIPSPVPGSPVLAGRSSNEREEHHTLSV